MRDTSKWTFSPFGSPWSHVACSSASRHWAIGRNPLHFAVMPSDSELSVIHYIFEREIDNLHFVVWRVKRPNTKMQTLSEVAEVSCAVTAQCAGQHKCDTMRRSARSQKTSLRMDCMALAFREKWLKWDIPTEILGFQSRFGMMDDATSCNWRTFGASQGPFYENWSPERENGTKVWVLPNLSKGNVGLALGQI